MSDGGLVGFGAPFENRMTSLSLPFFLHAPSPYIAVILSDDPPSKKPSLEISAC